MHRTTLTPLTALGRAADLRAAADLRLQAAARTTDRRAAAHALERSRVQASLLLVDRGDKPTRGRWA